MPDNNALNNNTQAKLCSFTELFSDSSEDGQEELVSIEIPKIQRDYAQGRESADIKRKRDLFLKALYNAISSGQGITLDFVFGSECTKGTAENGKKLKTLIPLDGQQRLTTLYLLHWYAAKKDKLPPDDYAFLKRFTYETRLSSGDFCKQLIDYNPKTDNSEPLSSGIVNQRWFPLDWKKDPTVASMLVMLDAIQDKFKDVEGLFEKLENIKFYYLRIDDIGITDDIYIKMNSRGKPLTLFENFKAEFERKLKLANTELADRIIKKADTVWMTVLWEYWRKEYKKKEIEKEKNKTESDKSEEPDPQMIDDWFLRFFRYICGIICFRNDCTTYGRNDDIFDLLDMYFSAETDPKDSYVYQAENNEQIVDNARTVESFFDCMCGTDAKPWDLFPEFITSGNHEEGKIKITVAGNDSPPDLFRELIVSEKDIPYGRQILLYAVISYLQNKDSISESDFRRRLRIINNLVINSSSEIRINPGENRMKDILSQTDSVIIYGSIGDDSESGFNEIQRSEEKEKLRLTSEHPEYAEPLFELEDHELLQGQIGIIGADKPELFGAKFKKLFSCDRDKVCCALMAVEDYCQKVKSNRYQYGSSSTALIQQWRNLFHKTKSNKDDFEKTSRALVGLLKEINDTDDKEAIEKMLDQKAEAYLDECVNNGQYTWRYYYIKYDCFRCNSYGKYHKNDEKSPYLFTLVVNNQRLSDKSYMPYLMEAAPEHVDHNITHGERLVYGDKYIVCTDDGYEVRKDTEKKENGFETLDNLTVPQENGIDKEDRVELLQIYIENHPELNQSAQSD